MLHVFNTKYLDLFDKETLVKIYIYIKKNMLYFKYLDRRNQQLNFIILIKCDNSYLQSYQKKKESNIKEHH